MHFSAILVTLSLSLTDALATPTLTSRQYGPAVGVIYNIQAQTTALAYAVSAYNGGNPTAVETAFKNSINTINSGVPTISSGAELSTNDADYLGLVVPPLNSKVQEIIDDLISKKDQFVSAGAGPTIYENLQDQYNGTVNLIKALYAKSSVADIQQADVSEIFESNIAAIQKGIDAYKDVATSTPSATSTSTTTATTTATASASASASVSSTLAGVTATSTSASASAATSLSTGAKAGIGIGAGGGGIIIIVLIAFLLRARRGAAKVGGQNENNTFRTEVQQAELEAFAPPSELPAKPARSPTRFELES